MANSKLTLSLNEVVIEAAKKYAKEKNISLSFLIENYLQKITTPNQPKKKSTPIVNKLSGVITLSKDFDYKKDYTDYLSEKYK